MPCLSIFADASLPWGLSKEMAVETTRAMAQWLVGNYGCAVEAAIHVKDGKIDHAHFLFTDRIVTSEGVGPKIRSMNGIADRSTEVEGGRRVATFAEATRAEWAQLTRLASANSEIDHRSFQRQGKQDKPCADIPRGRYEFELRHGITTSLDARKTMLAARAAAEVAEGAKTAGSSAVQDVKTTVGILPQQAAPSAEDRAPTTRSTPSQHVMPDVDIRATLDRAQIVHVSTAALEGLQRELQACTDPELYAELLRKLRSEQETVAIRTALEARRLEEERARMAAAQRNDWAKAFGASLVDGMLRRGTLRSGFEVRADSTFVGRAPAEISSPPQATTVPHKQTTIHPERPLTAPEKLVAEVTTSPISQPSDLRAAISWPHNTTVPKQADRLTPARAEMEVPPSSVRSPLPIPPAAIGDAAVRSRVEKSGQMPSPATNQVYTPDVNASNHVHIKAPTLGAETESFSGVSPADFAEIVGYAGALFKLRCLTPDAVDAFASMLGISPERLHRFARANVPDGSPEKAIQTAIAGATARNDAWAVALYQSFEPTPVQRKPARSRSRGFDMTD